MIVFQPRFLIRYLILFFILISFSNNTNAQEKLDSLLNIERSLKGGEKVDCYNLIAKEYIYANNLDKSIEYSNDAIELAKNIKDKNREVDAYNNLALVNWIMNNLEEAFDFVDKAIEISKSTNYSKGLGDAYNYQGMIYEKQEDFTKALDAYRESESIRRDINDIIGLSRTLNNMNTIYFNWGVMDKSIEMLNETIELKNQIGDKKGKAIATKNLADAYYKNGQRKEAIQNYQNALKVFDTLNIIDGTASCLNALGLTYENMGMYEDAIDYYTQSLKAYESIDYKYGMAEEYNNMGNTYMLKDDINQSLRFYFKSLGLYNAIDIQKGVAVNYQCIGGIHYDKLKDYDSSLYYYEKAYEINEGLGNTTEMAVNLNYIGRVNTLLGNYEKAIEALTKSQKIAKDNNYFGILATNYEFFSNVYKKIGNYEKALEFKELNAETKDTIQKLAQDDEINKLQISFDTDRRKQELKLNKAELEKKNLETKRQRIFMWSLSAIILLVLGMVGIVYRSLQQKKRDNKIIAAEKAKSEELLLNTLPVKVVNDLKIYGKTEPESFDEVTVYFSDVVGFTNLSTTLEPKILINELNDIFTAFDDIMIKHQCERIKTIGDAYMAVCGMPEKNPNHVENMINASLEIRDYMNERNSKSEYSFRIRIGIHTGKVVGGIVGVRKYIYDVFGDTINTASRMESNSEPMRINTSEKTYLLVKDKYKFEDRPPVDVKGKGVLKMYFIDSKIEN